jgi:hypothetical protein
MRLPSTQNGNEAALKQALYNGDWPTVWTMIVECGMNPNMKLNVALGEQCSCLGMIIKYAVPERASRYLKCMEILLRAGAQSDGDWAYARADRHIEAPITFLLKGVFARLVTRDGATLILKMMALLIKFYSVDADVEADFGHEIDDETDYMPLDMVLLWGHYEDRRAANWLCENAVAMLLEAGVGAQTLKGSLNIALQHVANPDLCLRLCEKLVVGGADVNQLMDDKTPLMWAVSRLGDECLALTALLLSSPDIVVSAGEVACWHPTHATELMDLLAHANAKRARLA